MIDETGGVSGLAGRGTRDILQRGQWADPATELDGAPPGDRREVEPGDARPLPSQQGAQNDEHHKGRVKQRESIV